MLDVRARPINLFQPTRSERTVHVAEIKMFVFSDRLCRNPLQHLTQLPCSLQTEYKTALATECQTVQLAHWFQAQGPASLAHTNISLFAKFSVKLIFSILCHVHISNASNSCLFALVNVQVSAAYSATFQTVLFIIYFFAHSSISLITIFSCP